MKVWTVITPDGEKLTWWGTWGRRILKRFPKMDKEGFVWLDGIPYVVDPKRFVRETYRPKKFLYLAEAEDQFQYWRQNEPDAINLSDLSLTPGSIGVTGETIKTFARSQHLKRLVDQDTNWYAILALLGIIGMIAAIAALYYRR